MNPILEVKNLVKHYGKVVAVDDVSFALEQGVCFGLLGPNGAGKTTTIEVIEDVIQPTDGEILYKGSPRTASFREEVGIQFQSTALLNFLTVRETLQTFQSFFTQTAPIDELVGLCRLGEFQDRYNDKISGGQRQRFLLALALINRPQLLFLDEPSTGLDPQARRNLWDLIQSIKAAGKTIILTTHYMEEAQFLCDEVAIMDYGKIIAQGTPDTLIRQHSRGTTIVMPKDRFTPRTDTFPLPVLTVKGNVEIKTNDVNQCLEQLMAHGVDLSDMTVRSPNLETVFLNLTGRQLRE
ncbi:MAG: ABC transporter ATP-binding protein [Deltaproteobacteria bacterium]|jgi:ABC-2 type transport system ATP-binding protein|nr:ABC transporter ATP-binding protein [Deltaproteobacteria bacterium]MBW2469183.1 ABC transporter ATP-binding protein [Deltaproteobacteria bacterium]